MSDASSQSAATPEITIALDVPADRRALAKAHAALLAETASKIALTLPFHADVDDFRRVLVREAKP